MKKTKMIVIAMIFIFLVLTGCLFVHPLKSETSQNVNEKECQENVLLRTDGTITQTFQCEVDDLNKITFQSSYKAEGILYHVAVKLEGKNIAEQDLICKNANGVAKISFNPQASKNKSITVEITNKSQEDLSLPKENGTKDTLNMTYYGMADNYFFAWYPLFVAAILLVVLVVI